MCTASREGALALSSSSQRRWVPTKRQNLSTGLVGMKAPPWGWGFRPSRATPSPCVRHGPGVTAAAGPGAMWPPAFLNTNLRNLSKTVY